MLACGVTVAVGVSVCDAVGVAVGVVVAVWVGVPVGVCWAEVRSPMQ